jgi:predicted lipoprotein with Yx(FWY)xxD motif
MRRRPLFIALALVVAASVLVAGTLAGASSAAPSKGAVVTVRKTKLGKVIVSANGRTLYLFEKDKHGKSACSGACAKAWPPLMTKGKPRAAGGAQAKLLGTTKRSNGTQVTYAGHPVYTFFMDSKAGQTNGEGSTAFGAAWYVVAPNGKKIDKS